MRQAEVLQRLVAALREAAGVVAIAAYGSTATRSWTPHSDVDLVAVVDHPPPAESVRFFVDGIAVDLNLRAADTTDRGIGGAAFVPEMAGIWDPRRLLRGAVTTQPRHDPEELRRLRYMVFHGLQKVRQIDDPGAARIANAGQVESVLRAWFAARGRAFRGIVPSLETLAVQDARLLETLNRALLSERGADLLAEAAELALAPAGAIFRPGEILIVDWSPPGSVDDLRELLGPVLSLSDPPGVYR